jgi:hypothetical protein
MDSTLYEFEQLPGAAPADGVEPAMGASPLAAAERSEPLIGVIRNPRSHRNKGRIPEMSDNPNVLTQAPQTRAELAGILAGFKAQGIDLLAVDGGDGTVRDVLTCGAAVYGDSWPPLVVLPKGKTNALAVDLGLPNEWSLPEALELFRQGRLVERKPILVDQPDGANGQVMGFILGAGLFTVATQAGQTAHRYGAFNSFAVALTAVFGIVQALFGIGDSPWRKLSAMRLYANGAEVPRSIHGEPHRRYAVIWSTLETFPLGMKLFGKVKGVLKYGALDMPLRRVVLLLPFLFAGWDKPLFARLGIHRGAAEEAHIEVEDRFILDGEAFPAGRYRLRTGPLLKFVAP